MLVVRLTKYQQIHPDIQPAAQQVCVIKIDNKKRKLIEALIVPLTVKCLEPLGETRYVQHDADVALLVNASTFQCCVT